MERWSVLSGRMAGRLQPRPFPRGLALLVCLLVFLAALSIRALHWQDSRVEIAEGRTLLTGLVRSYRAEARRIVYEGGVLFPSQPIDSGDARMIVHPPGYPILLVAMYGEKVSSSSFDEIRLLQIVCDAICAVLVFLIAAELLPFAVAVIGGLLVCVSPHLAYYSLWLSPDSLPVLPILLSVYLILRTAKQPRLLMVVAAGALIGISCWLRANALLLSPVLGVTVLLVFPRGMRLRSSAAFVLATVLVILPITIRNQIVFGRFVPLSIAAGENLIVGIADYDREGRFGMPASDVEAAEKDAEWHGRPDYANNPWTPDGIERDQARTKRGLAVIGADPVWFFSVALRRAAFMMSYNDSGPRHWPLNTSIVPIVSADPTFSHPLVIDNKMDPVWARSATELALSGSLMSPGAEGSLTSDGRFLRLIGDLSQYDDQFTSAPISVLENTDYLLSIPILIQRGRAAIKVTTENRRRSLAAIGIGPLDRGSGRETLLADVTPNPDPVDLDPPVLLVPFCSGNRSQVRLVVTNDGTGTQRPVTVIGEPKIFAVGHTRNLWTRHLRPAVRAIQKSLFKTTSMLPLLAVGILLLTLAKQGHNLASLLSVPLYYLSAQSMLSTEYRYILAIHYFLFVLAAVTLFFAGVTLKLVAQSIKRRFLGISH